MKLIQVYVKTEIYFYKVLNHPLRQNFGTLDQTKLIHKYITNSLIRRDFVQDRNYNLGF